MAHTELGDNEEAGLLIPLGEIEPRQDEFLYSWEHEEITATLDDTEPEEGHLLRDWLEGEPREHLSFQHHIDMLNQEQMDRFERDAERREYFLRKKAEFKREKRQKEQEEADKVRKARLTSPEPDRHESISDTRSEMMSSRVSTSGTVSSEPATSSEIDIAVPEQIVLLERAWALVEQGGLSIEEYRSVKSRILGSEH